MSRIKIDDLPKVDDSMKLISPEDLKSVNGGTLTLLILVGLLLLSTPAY
jgi:hypothetical protein